MKMVSQWVYGKKTLQDLECQTEGLALCLSATGKPWEGFQQRRDGVSLGIERPL